MKKEEDSELMNRLERHDDFRIIYDGDDFGIYKYNKETNRYEGSIGYLSMKSMLEIIKGKNDFIQAV